MATPRACGPGTALLIAVALLASACRPVGGGGVAYQPATYDVSGGGQDAGQPVDGAGFVQDGSVHDSGGGATDASVRAQDAATSSLDAAATDANKAGPDGLGGDAGASGSCAGKCGQAYQPQLSCQCNDVCSKYNNCCADWVALCQPALLSCKGRCETPYSTALPCQCHPDCLKKGSCCADYAPACGGVDLDFIKAKPGECDSDASWHKVVFSKDGDTVVLGNDDVVRLLVVNTPELSTEDCYAKEASSFTYKTMKSAGIICLVSDPGQPDKDQYGRLLRYVYYKEPKANFAPVQFNARLIRLGYGLVFYPWATGNVHEKTSLLMQAAAKGEKAGGWGVCPWN